MSDDALDPVIAALALTLDSARPSQSLRGRLLQRVAPPIARLGALRVDEGAWEETGVPGVTFRKLFLDPLSGMMTMLVRMAPGAHYPSHLHTRPEQCLVLEGDLRQAGDAFKAGDFLWGDAGTVHPETSSETGNLLLIVADPANEIVPA